MGQELQQEFDRENSQETHIQYSKCREGIRTVFDEIKGKHTNQQGVDRNENDNEYFKALIVDNSARTVAHNFSCGSIPGSWALFDFLFIVTLGLALAFCFPTALAYFFRNVECLEWQVIQEFSFPQNIF